MNKRVFIVFGFNIGSFTLSLNKNSPFRLWQTSAPGTKDAPVLLPGQTITNGVGVSWRTATTVSFYIEALASGSATLTYTFAGSGAAAGITASSSLKTTACCIDWRRLRPCRSVRKVW